MKTLVLAGFMMLGAACATAQEPSAAPSSQSPDDTLARVVPLPEVVVSTTRLDERAPIARSLLGRAELLQRNWGQDTPMALAALPGAYAYSDAGSGIGYSYLSIRGFPQRRISVLIDGVPLNDPESHEVYWIDHPDLLASTSEAQLQRGVGSALYGAASVGGSVNLETAPFSEAPGARGAIAYGSYETKRLMAEMSSGQLAGGWNFYGRYSRIETAGYREQSDTELWSYAFSARRLFGSQSLRVNLFGGPETTHLAYLGVPREYLEGRISGDPERDRRFNPIGYEGERDHFFEPHYEVVHSWAPSAGLALTQTLFWFDGAGYYDEQRLGQDLAAYRLSPWVTTDSTLFPRAYYRDANGDGALDRDAQGRVTVDEFDVVRRRFITNHHFGWIPRVRIEHAGGALTLGGELRGHDGHHVGTVISGSGLPPGTEADHRYYDFHPRTFSSGLFAREEWQLGAALRATADLSWRHQGYLMRGDHFDGVRFDQPYDFALPRVGLTWSPRPELAVFAAGAHSRREPALRDLYDGEGFGAAPLLRNGAPLVRPEKVNDYELGGSWRHAAASPSSTARTSREPAPPVMLRVIYDVKRRLIAALEGSEAVLSANLFRMDFRDELVYAGQFNTDLGYPIIGNAARSVHQGIELALRAERRLAHDLSATLDANTTLSDNHFVTYREVYGTSPGDTVKYDGNAIGFFPSVIGNVSARLGWRGARLGIEAQHVGRIHLDNTETRSASIAPRTVLDLIGGYAIPLASGGRLELSLRVFNLFDKAYETGGYMDYDASGNLAPRFIPAAERHVLGEVRIEL